MAPETINSAKSTVAVVGLGKIGLPIAVQFARKGMNVIGCDVLPDVVDGINKGLSHIHEEAGLVEGVAAVVADGKLQATIDTAAAVAKASVVVVIVPLMVSADWKIDFRSLDSATHEIARGLRSGTLVVYETTLPVGTTRRRLGPMLEKGSGLAAGSDFHLAFSPERLYAGRIFEDLHHYPKIVGGVDAASTERAAAFYASVLDAEVWPVKNAETAEFAKLAETTYRDVNIALANQLALFGAARDVDVATAFNAANSQPFSHLHRPSIGVGGHCIPVYPHFLLTDAAEGELSLVSTGRQANDSMAAVCVDQLSGAMGGLRGRRVLVLGVSYREDVKELAFSTAVPLIDLLHRAGAQVLIHDPLFKPEELDRFDAEVVDLSGTAVSDVEAVIVQALHKDLKSLDWRRFKQLRVVFDGRGAVDAERVRAAGARYLAVGVDGRVATPRGPK
jgi:nucleotide sugar dehydrogenase